MNMDIFGKFDTGDRVAVRHDVTANRLLSRDYLTEENVEKVVGKVLTIRSNFNVGREVYYTNQADQWISEEHLVAVPKVGDRVKCGIAGMRNRAVEGQRGVVTEVVEMTNYLGPHVWVRVLMDAEPWGRTEGATWDFWFLPENVEIELPNITVRPEVAAIWDAQEVLDQAEAALHDAIEAVIAAKDRLREIANR